VSIALLSLFRKFKITKFHFVILGGVSANEVNFFAFGLHENSGFKILTEHKGTKAQRFEKNRRKTSFL